LGDPTRLGQIIFNLVNNAIKFTHRGYVKLVLENKAESETDITYSITVKDTGIGIDAEKQKTIFEEFEQADAQTNRKFGGSGLGLTISQKLLQHMNSGLILSSKVGEGTEFTFQITLNKALDIDTGFNHLETKQIKGSKNKKVLIVEDNKINLLILERFVQDLNLIPVTAINGKEGVEKATSESFDLILMDLQMPEMDGYEASKKIAESLAENKPPILAISAANESNIRQNLVEYGMEDYVTKPIDPEQFNRKVMLYV
jgi:CheY-like chemotaxis protein